MSRAEQLRAKAKRLNPEQAAVPSPAADAPAPARSTQPRSGAQRATGHTTVANPQVKPVRSTVDLPASRHAALKAWAAETAVEIGTSRVTTQDVMAALVGRLLTDASLARRVAEDIRETKNP